MLSCARYALEKVLRRTTADKPKTELWRTGILATDRLILKWHTVGAEGVTERAIWENREKPKESPVLAHFVWYWPQNRGIVLRGIDHSGLNGGSNSNGDVFVHEHFEIGNMTGEWRCKSKDLGTSTGRNP